MLPDSGRTRVRIDHDIFHNREGLQRMSEMRDDDEMTRPDDIPFRFGDEERVIAIVCETIEAGGQFRPRNAQIQIIL